MDAPGAGRREAVELQEKLIRANVIAALRMVGGHEYDIIRTPRDLNGQPSGPPAQADPLARSSGARSGLILKQLEVAG